MCFVAFSWADLTRMTPCHIGDFELNSFRVNRERRTPKRNLKSMHVAANRLTVESQNGTRANIRRTPAAGCDRCTAALLPKTRDEPSDFRILARIPVRRISVEIRCPIWCPLISDFVRGNARRRKRYSFATHSKRNGLAFRCSFMRLHARGQYLHLESGL
jgi:hypothetical protein